FHGRLRDPGLTRHQISDHACGRAASWTNYLLESYASGRGAVRCVAWLGGDSTKTVCAPCFSKVMLTVRPMACVRWTEPAGTTMLCHSVRVTRAPPSKSI